MSEKYVERPNMQSSMTKLDETKTRLKKLQSINRS